jgi:two-component system chemotaxis sensor kinase CheA
MDMGGDELKEILEEFFTEADENLDALEQDLIQLEALALDGATDRETVARLFRVLHTLKGGAGFLGLERIAKLAHAGENLLDEVRNDKVAVTKPVMDALLQTNDMLKQLLGFQKRRQDDAGVDTEPLRLVLEALANGKQVAVPMVTKPSATPAPVPAAVAAPVAPGVLAAPEVVPSALANTDLLASVLGDPTLAPERDKGDDGPSAGPAALAVAPVPEVVPSALANTDLLASVLGDPTLAPERDKGDDGPNVTAAAPVAMKPVEMAREVAPVERRQPGTDRRAEAPAADDRRAQPTGRRNEDGGGETIRVEIARLDKVMNLVGELVLARNTMLRQLSLSDAKQAIDKLENASMIYGTLEQFSRVTQDLQMSVLSTRMQPIKKVFDKIPRQVRELKTKLNKEVSLIIEGEMTEVDKSLVEELADPMMHMIRNALDHGLEGPDERTAVGKHPEGTLLVRAFYEGNNVVIQVQEDGRGIDPQRIRNVAIKKGIISQVAANALSDNEAIRLIMAAGFSTAETITDVSGRGVGMDVVNTKIMNLQGNLDIASELGMGTCFSIYMPLTLAIVNALIVGSQNEGFAIPIGDIAEVIKFPREGIHRVNDQDVIELRGEPLPLYYLGRLTKEGHTPRQHGTGTAGGLIALEPRDDLSLDDLEHAVQLATQGTAAAERSGKARPDGGFVVVVRDGSSAMGLVVDALLGQEEVVVKPVTSMFEFNKAISGATITGEGKVHMILDVPYLLKDLSGAR